MLAPVALTTAAALELTVNGPSAWPVVPFALEGVMVRLGGVGALIGPSAITFVTSA
jgi:hypothetical protein